MKYQKITLSLASLTSMSAVSVIYATDVKTAQNINNQATTVVTNVQSKNNGETTTILPQSVNTVF